MTTPNKGRARQRRRHVESINDPRGGRSKPSGNALAGRSATLVPQALADRCKFCFMTPAELRQLKIDGDNYQRWRIADSVAEIVARIEAGGYVPAPIVVAHRTDGTSWIVDGQQRWWAAYHTNTGLNAQVFENTTVDEERLLFTVYNDHRIVAAGFRIHGSAGPSGKLMRWLVENNESPLKGLTGWESSAQPYPASLVFRAVAAGALGLRTAKAISPLLIRLDVEILDGNGPWITKCAKMVAVVIRNVFSEEERRRIRMLPAIAVGLICRKHWEDLKVTDAWPMPTTKQYERIGRLNWLILAPDQKAIRITTLVESMERIWPAKKGAKQ